MKKRSILIILLNLCIILPSYAQTTLISYGSNWSYYDLANEPPPQSSLNWMDLGYSDTSWSSGDAQLGYGDGDETTMVNSGTLTCYFRHTLNIADPSVYDNLDLDLIYDDGAVVYLNGTEIWRVNMPTGPIDYNTFSATTSSDNAMASVNISNSLISGTNVLSVEIHQRSSSSSDISFDFKLTGNPPGLVNVVRGPYLQKSSPTSMTIKWRTSTATETYINYGTSLGSLNQTASDNTATTEHEIQINGLNPNTTYYYEVANASNVLIASAADLYFRTSPIAGSSQPVTAWVLGDCGTANNNARAVRDAYYSYIGSNHTDVVLFLGDNAYNDGTDSEYQFALFENMYEDKLKNSVSWSCLGNHDGHSANSNTQTGPYYDIFSFPTAGESGGVASGTEAYYSFNYGNIHFISLDSYETDRSVGGSMYNWCESDIQNTTADWIVAFWHHPPYSKGSHNSDSESALVEMRQNFLPMLENNGVDLVLSGHSHSYERSYLLNGHYGNSGSFNTVTHTVGVSGSGDGKLDGNGAYEKTTTGPDAGDGAVYITAGSSGKITAANLNHPAMYYSVASLGSCILEVEGDTMGVKFIRETGAIDDYFTIIKSNATCTSGDPCDDLNACTINDVYDVNCNCSGIFQDTDGDGVCDANDQCPGQDDNLIGTSCNDADSCTINDVYDSNCQCAGTYTDQDGDGFCVGVDPDDTDGCNPDPNSGSCDPCIVVNSESFESGFGIWNDGGNDCARVTSNANTGSYSIRIRDNSGSSSSFFTDNLDLSSAGSVVVEFSFITVSMESGEDFFLEYSTNGGNSYTIFTEWNSGVEFQNGVRQDVSVELDMITFTAQSRIRLRCDASGNNDQVYIDDLVIKTCAISCTDGDPCDDGDPCTTGDTYDVNCNCTGTFQDADGDGVCDANDQCPGQDDGLIGTSCDDFDDCTINDVYDSNCQCAGTYTDQDGDGICIADDPDDQDGCNPDPNSGACNPCTIIFSDGFESGFGNWNDGGNDCARTSSNANTGSYSIRLRDNSGAPSSMHSDVIDLSGSNSIQIDFSFIANSMESGEDFFLEISTNGGSSYSLYTEWNSGVEFQNGQRYNESIVISNYSFSTSTRFRFRCDASSNNDQVFIDDVVISDCSISNLISSTPRDLINIGEDENIKLNFNIYPVPVRDRLYLTTQYLGEQKGTVLIYNILGEEEMQLKIDAHQDEVFEISMDNLRSGVYFVTLIQGSRRSVTKQVTVVR